MLVEQDTRRDRHRLEILLCRDELDDAMEADLEARPDVLCHRVLCFRAKSRVLGLVTPATEGGLGDAHLARGGTDADDLGQSDGLGLTGVHSLTLLGEAVLA